MKKIIKNQKSKGFTLIEIMAVLVVAAAMATGIMYVYSSRIDNAKADTLSTLASTSLRDLSTAMTVKANNDATIATSLNDGLALQTGQVPTNLIKSTNPVQFISPWGYPMGYSAQLVSNGAGNVYSATLTVQNLSSRQCGMLASKFMSNNSIDVVTVNGTTVKNTGLNTYNSTQAQTSCGNNASTVTAATFINPVPSTIAVGGGTIAAKSPYLLSTYAVRPANMLGSCASFPGTSTIGNNDFCGCPNGQTWNGNSCIAITKLSNSAKYTWYNGQAYPTTAISVLSSGTIQPVGTAQSNTNMKACVGGQTFNYVNNDCECPAGTVWNSSQDASNTSGSGYCQAITVSAGQASGWASWNNGENRSDIRTGDVANGDGTYTNTTPAVYTSQTTP